MLRSKRILLICHCILNQNSMVHPLARAAGAFNIVHFLEEKGIGLIQLPCPEFKYLGLARKPMTKEEYNTPEYRTLCRDLFLPILEDIKEYIKNSYEIIGILGIDDSPTCSIRGCRGIFMEEVFSLFSKEGIKISNTDIPVNYEDSTIEDLKLKLQKDLML
jgi:predicted secreted protein